MLDINDIFLYTPNAMGTGTFTDNTVDRNGSVSDNNQLNPTQANRVRGLASANIARDNFESIGRVPIDPIAIDSVEISRGPNASVFGLGNASGTVNNVGARANLSRNFTRVAFRTDSTDGSRISLDANRALTSSLAIRISGVFQHDGFERQALRHQRGALQRDDPVQALQVDHGDRLLQLQGRTATGPNDTLPRDSVSYWASQRQAGLGPDDPD